jgi:hypothetical protein
MVPRRNSHSQASPPHIEVGGLRLALTVSGIVNYGGPGGLDVFRRKLGITSKDVPKDANLDQIIDAFIAKTKAQQNALPKQDAGPA